jgi:DNA-binding NtrC family response regulator
LNYSDSQQSGYPTPNDHISGLPAILLVDDDAAFAEDIALLIGDHYQVSWVGSAEEAKPYLLTHNVQAILLDIDLGAGMDGLNFLDQLQVQYPEVPVIVLSGDRSIQTVSSAIRRGASSYIGKRPKRDDLIINLDNAIKLSRSRVQVRSLQESMGDLKKMVGQSQFMQSLCNEIERYAVYNSTIVITGETGTGKEYVAQAVHRLSARKEEPFLSVNCTAFSGRSLESELFGHEEGAFIGAGCRQLGRLQETGQGTLFLDEIADIDLETQARLLEALNTGKFRPLGGSKEIPFQGRLIVASNRDLVSEVRDGLFHKELFYRINVLRLHLIPLRERPEDISDLAVHLLHKKADEQKRVVPTLDPDVMNLLQSQAWRGNIRELAGTIENALCNSDGDSLHISDFQQLDNDNYQGLSYLEAKEKAMEVFHLSFLSSILKTTDGNISAAAQLIDVPRQTLHRLMNKRRLKASYFKKRIRTARHQS